MDNAAEIHNRLLEKPKTSQSELSREFGISKSFAKLDSSGIDQDWYFPVVFNIAIVYLESVQVHPLNENDPDRRLQFCGEFQKNMIRILC